MIALLFLLVAAPGPYATGVNLLRAGKRAEAAVQFRAAIAKDPRRSSAYVALASLLAEDPRRWDVADEMVAILDRGVGAVRGADALLAVHLARADFLRRLGRGVGAADAYRRAASFTRNAAEQRFLAARAEECASGGTE